MKLFDVKMTGDLVDILYATICVFHFAICH